MDEITDEDLAKVFGAEATGPEKVALDFVDWGISKFDSSWAKKDCAGRFGYLGWGYGYTTGTSTTLLLASKTNKKLGVGLGLVTSLYGARLNSIYVDNCKAKGEGSG